MSLTKHWSSRERRYRLLRRRLRSREKWSNTLLFVKKLGLDSRKQAGSQNPGISGVRTRFFPHASLHVRRHSSPTYRDDGNTPPLSLIHISEPTRRTPISYA